jgi:hydroxymethylglutaryl-CoA synthase
VIKVGIDTIAFYTSRYSMDLSCLAERRGVDPAKFSQGLGQQKMSVPAPDEDIVTMAANAALRALHNVDKTSIEMLLFATESGIDQSKAAGIYVHDLLDLKTRCRVIELKQACYSGTLALQLALPFIRQHPDKKVLLITSDIARYGLGSVAESSQGCGAVAMVLSANPRLLAFDHEYGVVTENVMDFWRPNYSDQAFVEGKYSSKLYLNMLEKAWLQYSELSSRGFPEHDYFCYHAPVPRLVERAHQHLAKINNQLFTHDELDQQVSSSLEYARIIGNSYIYGSGCVAEYFSGVIAPEYKQVLNTDYHQQLLAERTPLSYAEYEAFYSFKYPEDGTSCKIPFHQTGSFRLASIHDHKRHYERVT